jgi:Flp pilus assembly protein TadG
MIFALCLFALVMALGIAVDIGRAVHTKTRISSALDAAALAAAKSMHEKEVGTGELIALARRFFEANLGARGLPTFGEISAFGATIDKAGGTVTVSATANVPTLFARVGGIDAIRLPATSVAAYDPKDIELSLSLDVTGSMCSPCTKIDDLRAAARDLVDILLPRDKASTNKVRIALAPFSAGVNAGAYVRAATNRSGSDSCAFERDGADQVTDEAPAGGRYLKIAGDPGVASTRNNCPAGAEVAALSDDADEIKRAIDRLRTGGTTAGHLGTAWAWYLVSPKWASVWPAVSRPVDYGNERTVKAVVLMTDGLYNTFGGSNSSSKARQSQDVASQLCANMKGFKVKVYSIGFRLDDPRAEAVLRECATSGVTFFRAESGEELRKAFRSIAEDLLRLRLSR